MIFWLATFELWLATEAVATLLELKSCRTGLVVEKLVTGSETPFSDVISSEATLIAGGWATVSCLSFFRDAR